MRLYETVSTSPRPRFPCPNENAGTISSARMTCSPWSRCRSRGRPIAEICARFKISRAQVHKDLQAFYEFTKNDRSQKKREKRDRLLVELGVAKRELWKAWHLSKKDKEVQTQEKTSARDGGGVSQERSKASLRSEGRLPHCPYMAEWWARRKNSAGSTAGGMSSHRPCALNQSARHARHARHASVRVFSE